MRIQFPFALVACAFLILGIGCASIQPQAPEKPPEPAENPGKVEAPAPADESEVSADGGGEAAPSGGGKAGLAGLEGLPEDVKRSLQELEKNKTLEGNAQDAVIANYLTSANRLLADGRPQEAREYVTQALKVRPGHAEAIDLLNRIDFVISRPGGEGAAAFTGLQNLVQVKVQEALVEARAHYNKGVDLFNALSYDEALKEFERVLEIIRWAPYHVDLSGYRERVEAYIHRCNKLKGLEQMRRTRAIQEKATNIALVEERQRRRRDMQKVELLFKEAVLLFEQRQYIKAERLARQVLDQNPRHKLARRLIDDCIEARHMLAEKRFVRQKVEEWRKLLASFDELKVPYSQTARWPSLNQWKRICNRKIPGMGGFDGEADPDVRHIQSTLQNETISLDFKDSSLNDVVEFIRNTKNINIVVDPEVLSNFESEGRTVNLQVEELNLGDALNILMRFNSLTYTFRNKVLFITTPEGAHGDALMRLHDVRDLTRKLEHFKGPDLELKSGDGGGAAPPMFEEDGGEQEVIQVSDLVDMIRESVAPDTWDQGGFRITQIHGMLLVSHTAKVHSEIAALLDDLRKYSGLLVTIEARFLTVEDDFLEDIGADFRGLGNEKGTDAYLDDVTVGMEDFAGGAFDNGANGNPTQPPSSGIFFNDNSDGDMRARTEGMFDRGFGGMLKNTGGLSLQYTLLDDAEVNVIFHAVSKSRRATLLNAPKLTAFNTQRANITLVNQISYVRDYDVEVAQAAAIADPIMGVIQDGLVLDVRPTVSNDRKYITLELRPCVATLVRPIPTLRTTLGMAASSNVTLHMPELVVQKAQATVRVPDGGTILLGGLKEIVDMDEKAEIPWFANIPILSFLTSRKGRSIEKKNLLLVVQAQITDLTHEEKKIRVD
ncbi:MAG: hypothetical protein ACYTFG_09580 [Planctomycetota bacterium]